MLEGLNGLLEDIGFSIKDSVSKIKDAGTTYAASTPYGQAASRGSSIFSKPTTGNKSRFTPSIAPTTSATSMTPTSRKGLSRGTLRQVLTGKKKVFGVPVLFLGAGVGAFFLIKKLKKRR